MSNFDQEVLLDLEHEAIVELLVEDMSQKQLFALGRLGIEEYGQVSKRSF